MTRELAKMQRELASLLLEPGQLTEFRRGRAAYAKRRGLRAGSAKQFGSLSPAGLSYFASRRRIDRRGYLSAAMPRTVAAADRAGALRLYFAEEPYALENWTTEARRFARWVVRRARRNPALTRLAAVAMAESPATKRRRSA